MKISNSESILILSHFYRRALYGGGPPQEIRDYFLPKVRRIYYIEHPFPYSKEHRSFLTVYENGKIKNLPILVFSTLGQEKDVKRAMELGAKGFINKSFFDFNSLLEKIKQLAAK